MLLLGGPIGAANFVGGRAVESLVALPASKRQRAVREGRLQGAAGLDRVAAIAETALAGQRDDISKRGLNAGLGGPRLDFAHAGGIDHDDAVGRDEQFALRGGVATLAVDLPHRLGVL